MIGHAPNRTEAYIYGDKGSLAFITPLEGEAYLQLAKKGGSGLAPVAIDPPCNVR